MAVNSHSQGKQGDYLLSSFLHLLSTVHCLPWLLLCLSREIIVQMCGCLNAVLCDLLPSFTIISRGSSAWTSPRESCLQQDIGEPRETPPFTAWWIHICIGSSACFTVVDDALTWIRLQLHIVAAYPGSVPNGEMAEPEGICSITVLQLPSHKQWTRVWLLGLASPSDFPAFKSLDKTED